jgi:solute:Na+ symporter, SSS family
MWIIQTLPAVFLGLYTRWFNRWALVIGWAAGITAGTTMFIATQATSSVYAITIGGLSLPPMYAAFTSVVLNIVLAVVLTPVFELIGARRGADETAPGDYSEEVYLAPEHGKEALG